MRKRGLDQRFLAAMRSKLDHGRRRGYIGWDEHWNDCYFDSAPEGPTGFFMTRLLQEVVELTIAVASKDPGRIKGEAADVANFAMMVADIHDALDECAEEDNSDAQTQD